MNLFTLALWCCALALQAQAQPTACKEESHCPTGFFCQTDVHFCQECMRCEDLKRQPPQQPSSCIQSVSDCGYCMDGLIEDLTGDVTAQCVEATARGQGSLPVYVWVAIVAGLLFFVIVVAIVVYALRNKELFKNVVSGETSVRSSRMNGTRPQEPPPPYNDQYMPVRPSSPPAHPAAPPSLPSHPAPLTDDSTWAFMKAAPAPPPPGARESAGAQAAQVYNNPAYVRGPFAHHPHHTYNPPSYDSGEESEPHTPFTVHDEDTMESPWTPHENNNENTTSGALASVPELTEVTTVARTDVPPPAKRPRLPQDSNNNQGGGPASAAEAPSTSSPPGVTINVLVHQRNDLRL